MATLAVAAVTPAAAAAHLITVGSPLTANFHEAIFKNTGTFFNSALEEQGANVVSPVDGAVVGFRILGGEGGPYLLRVLSPDGGSVYTAKASSAPLTFGAPVPVMQPLKIKAGDTVGLDLPESRKLAVAETGPLSAYAAWVPALAAGATLPYKGTKTERELAFNAVVLPVPAVSRVVPKEVDPSKRSRVRIYGDDFREVRKVRLGDRRLGNFIVVSEHLIVAAIPRRKHNPPRAFVRIKTVAGTSRNTSASAVKLK
ncbi:MAG: IPT/TIG domain-containing protein [Solirubrobacterales bacterium]